MSIVYIHRRKDNNEIFYVGMGKNNSRSISHNNRNTHWHNVVNKYNYIIEITHKDLIWEEAISIEKYLIAFWSKNSKVNLVNQNEGGVGNLGYKFDRDKILIRNNKIKQTLNKAEIKEKRSIAIKKVRSTEESRKKTSIASTISNARLETREKISKSSKFHNNKEGQRLKLSILSKLAHSKPEVKEKHRKATSEGVKKWWEKRKINKL
jgi:hypothetical protein